MKSLHQRLRRPSAGASSSPSRSATSSSSSSSRLVATAARAPLEGRLTMSARSPLRRPRSRDPRPPPDYSVVAGVALARRASPSWSGGSTTRASSRTTSGSRSSRPRYIEAHPGRRPARHPPDGLQRRPRRASSSAWSSASASSPTTRWLRWPCWLVVEFFRAVPVILLMIFCLLRHLRRHGRAAAAGTYWAVVIGAHPLQRRRARRGLPRRHQRRAEGPGRGGVRHRHAQDPGDDDRAAARRP